MRIVYTILLLIVALPVFTQSIVGTVRDENGEALVNANVILDDGTKGSITDKTGRFFLGGIDNGLHRLTVSFLGYESSVKEISISNNSNTLNFILSVDNTITSEVLITAKLNNESSLMKLPTCTQSIDRKEIESIPAIQISNIFSKVSGVDVQNEFGMFSSKTVVTLRGVSGGSQKGTLVVVDGVPINKSESGSVNWNMINKNEIERIEVIKGPASVLYGSNAMGGIINIITSKPKTLFSTDLSLAYGRYNTVNSSIKISGRSNNNLLYWKLFASYNQSDGYINTPDEIIEENDTIVRPVFLNEKLISGEIGYYFNEHHQVSFKANVFDDLRGTGVQIYENLGANVEHDTYKFSTQYIAKYSKVQTSLNLYFINENYNRLNEYYSDGEYKLYAVDAIRQDYGARLLSEWQVAKQVELTAGIEYKTGKSIGEDVYYTSSDLISNRGSMSTWAAFAQLNYSMWNNKVHIVPGIRYDRASFYDAMFTIYNPSYSIEYLVDFQFNNIQNTAWDDINPKLSVSYDIKTDQSLYFSIARGFSAPILEDLCRTGRKRIGFKIANPNLKPEFITNYEIGGNFRLFKNLYTSFSTYYIQGKDFMSFLSTGDTVNLGYTLAPVFQSQNISKVEIIGFETNLQFDINKKIQVYANYTYNHSVIKEFVPNSAADINLTGKFLTDIPMHKFASGAVFRNKIVNLSLSGKYVGSRWVKDDNTIDNVYLMSSKYPAYFIFDLKFWRTFGDVNVSVSVENLFNNVYVNNKGYKSPGIFYMCKINYCFKYY